MAYLNSGDNAWIVIVACATLSYACYVVLDRAKQLRIRSRNFKTVWRAGAPLALGTGIWSTHFAGMIAVSPTAVHDINWELTVASWIVASSTAFVALYVTSRSHLNRLRMVSGALAMGIGIYTMHHAGMAAIVRGQENLWNPVLATSTALVAAAISSSALRTFFWLRRIRLHRNELYQAIASLVLAAGLCSLGYTGMATLILTDGTVALGVGALVANCLGSVLAVTVYVSILDARTKGKSARLTDSLQVANIEVKTANEELRRREFLDPLTGLPNRLLFEDRVAHALKRNERADEWSSRRRTENLAVLFLDLDGFKSINDSLGHAAGDRVLMEVATRIRNTARSRDTVARIGADEFVLLMEAVPGSADCETMARRLVEAVGRPVEIAGRQVGISASVGIVVFPDRGHKDKLIAQADAAMHAAKRAGGNSYAMYEPHMDGDALAQLSLQCDLRHAIERGELQLHYQPKVDAQHGKLCGVEALLRWSHPERGIVSPCVFIPIAERNGLINTMGNWVIDEACRQMQAWACEGVRMCVAINLSVHQLRQEDLVERIRAALRRHQIDASQLMCEITESSAMDDIEISQRAFDGLAHIGVFLSIDDFGTGHSSLSYLRQLPARQLKIDRSFVRDLEASDDARAIVGAVVQLAHALGLRVVAEGVETEAQRDILLGLGCDELQGYFFAEPMAADALPDWVRENQSQGPVELSAPATAEAADAALPAWSGT